MTGIAEARVIAMADAEAMLRANRLLEAMHSCQILNYDAAIAGSFEATKDPDHGDARSLSCTPRDTYWQPAEKVLVSCASSRLLGTFRVTAATFPMFSHPKYVLADALLDLEHEKVVQGRTSPPRALGLRRSAGRPNARPIPETTRRAIASSPLTSRPTASRSTAASSRRASCSNA